MTVKIARLKLRQKLTKFRPVDNLIFNSYLVVTFLDQKTLQLRPRQNI